MKSCKLILAVRGRDIDTFAATHTGLITAQRAASKAARGIGSPAATVTQVCPGVAPEVLVKCTASRCTSGLAGARRPRPRARAGLRGSFARGDRFDFFGKVYEVVKVRRDGKVVMAERVADAFGKEALIGHKEFHPRDVAAMRPLK